MKLLLSKHILIAGTQPFFLSLRWINQTWSLSAQGAVMWEDPVHEPDSDNSLQPLSGKLKLLKRDFCPLQVEKKKHLESTDLSRATSRFHTQSKKIFIKLGINFSLVCNGVVMD